MLRISNDVNTKPSGNSPSCSCRRLDPAASLVLCRHETVTPNPRSPRVFGSTHRHGLSFGALKIPPKLTDFLIRADKFGTPTQRIVIGSTAMFLQPMIDLKNKKVDDKTRQTAASRSFSRAIVGTISGIAVRTGCIKLGEKLSENGKAFWFDGLNKLNKDQFQNYSKAVGNVLALGVLLFTNFLFDVPLITKMSTYINKKVFGNEPANAKSAAGGKVPSAKIRLREAHELANGEVKK